MSSVTGFSSSSHCESESLKALKVLKDKLWLHLVSSVTGFSYSSHCKSESLKALKVLRDKLWLHLVSSVTGFPFHTIVRVSETNIAPPPWLLVPSHREMHKFKKEIIILNSFSISFLSLEKYTGVNKRNLLKRSQELWWAPNHCEGIVWNISVK